MHSVATYQLSEVQQSTLTAAATRLGVTVEVALEMAISRLALSAGLMSEGDLSRLDMSQSLEYKPGSEASSKSLPCVGG